MIKFQITEVREIPELGQVPVTHNYTIRPEDVKSWDEQEFTVKVKQKDDEGVEVDKVVVEKVLAVVMKETHKSFESVEVPKFKTVGKELTVVYTKEIREIEKNLVYSFPADQMDSVLVQLNEQIK